MTSIVSKAVSEPFNGSRQNTIIHCKIGNNSSYSQTETNQTVHRKSHYNINQRSHSIQASNKNYQIEARASKNHRGEEERDCSDFIDDHRSTKHQKENTQNRSKKDRKIAKLQQKEKNRKSKKQMRREKKDRKLAQKIQDIEKQAFQKSSLDRVYKAMMLTNLGKAILVVERIIRLVESMKIANDLFKFGMRAVAKDDMVYFAEQLLAKQEEFKAKEIPFEVDIGYHYTSEESMNAIQTNGLMTKEDRIKNNIHVQSKGNIFGDGVYTANNPTSFMKFGRVGLIVARLKGKTIRIAKRLGKTHRKVANTIIGDKSAKSRWWWPEIDSLHEIVLQNSSQCLPLVRYDRKSLRGRPVQGWKPDAYIQIITESLKAVLDEIFNGHEVTRPPLLLPLCGGTPKIVRK